MRKITWLSVLFIVMLALTACQLFTSQMLDRMPLEGQTLSHVKKTIEGRIIKLNIDIDVTEYADKEFGVYDACPLKIDHEVWFDYFFPGIDRSELTHIYDGINPDDFEYNDELTVQLSNETFAYYLGDIDEIEKLAAYVMTISWFTFQQGDHSHHIAENNTLKINEEDKRDAEALGDAFMAFVAGDRLVRTSSDTVQTEEDEKAVCILRYDRLIEGLPLFVDKPLWLYDESEPLDTEGIDVWIMDGKVVCAHGFIRDIEKQESFPIIALEQALNILTLYVDTVNAFTQDYIDGITEKSEFDINKIELAYYPVLIEDAELLKSFAGRRAYATYRPAWCIASGERSGNTDVFVMVIDAITGEVIG